MLELKSLVTCGKQMKLVFDWRIFIRVIFSSAYDAEFNTKVALKKLSRPFQSLQHAKRTYREIKLLKMMNHENEVMHLVC